MIAVAFLGGLAVAQAVTTALAARFGGMTGDLYGATNEVAEVVTLGRVASLASTNSPLL